MVLKFHYKLTREICFLNRGLHHVVGTCWYNVLFLCQFSKHSRSKRKSSTMNIVAQTSYIALTPSLSNSITQLIAFVNNLICSRFFVVNIPPFRFSAASVSKQQQHKIYVMRVNEAGENASARFAKANIAQLMLAGWLRIWWRWPPLQCLDAAKIRISGQ